VSTSAPNELLRGRIDRNQFIEIYKDVATRPEVYFLMVRYANKDYLNWQDLQNFLETEQGVFFSPLQGVPRYTNFDRRCLLIHKRFFDAVF
jgi:hypothetical protein